MSKYAVIKCDINSSELGVILSTHRTEDARDRRECVTDRSPGRPLIGTERRERYQVRLEPSLAAWLDKLGDGNRSAGIERAAKAAGWSGEKR